jgi:hypothetical protein
MHGQQNIKKTEFMFHGHYTFSYVLLPTIEFIKTKRILQILYAVSLCTFSNLFNFMFSHEYYIVFPLLGHQV